MLNRHAARTLLLVLSLLLAVPGTAQDANLDYEKGVQAYHEGKYEDALIHLKYALQQDPNLIAARLLLAQVHFNAGDVGRAEKESNEALLLGADINLVLPIYGQSLLLQKKIDKLFEIEKVSANFTRDSKFEWALLKGQGYLIRGERELARGEFQRAATILPANVRSNNTLAAIYIRSGMHDEARALIEKSLLLEPQNEKIWELRGELTYKEKDYTHALEYFLKGHELDPEDIRLQRALARVYLQLGDRERAQQYLDLMLKQSPDDPAATLLSAILLIGDGDIELGESMLANLAGKLSQLESNQTQFGDSMKFIQASAEYIQRNDATAINLFNSYLAKNRDDITALRLLVDLYLRNDEIRKATEVLSSRETLVATDPGLSAQLLNLYVLSNNHHGAESVLGELKKSGVGENPYVLVLEAELLRAKGQPDAALASLDGYSLGEKEPLSYGLSRGALQLELKKYADAQQSVQRLQKAFPDNIKVNNFAAVTCLTVGELNNAQTYIEKAIALDPGNIDARFNQAMLHKKRGNLEESGIVLQAIVAEHPGHIKSILLMARILFLQDKFDEAIDWTDRVYAYDAGSTNAGELQLEIYTETGDWRNATLVVQRLIRENPLNSDYLLRLATIALNSNDNELAQNTLRRLYPLWNKDPERLRQLAQLQARAGKTMEARKSLQTALALDSQSYGARLDMARLDIAAGQYDKADSAAAAMQQESGKRTESSMLLGEIALARNQLEVAQGHFVEAFQLDKSNADVIAKLYQLGIQGIGAQAFIDTMEATLKESSLPAWVVRLLADSYLAQGKLAPAQMYYEKLLALPEYASDSAVLNNLANIYAVENLDKALATAQKGLDAEGAERSAALLDTVGWILSQRGENERALSYLRKAYAKNSADPEIRYHTGVTLRALGRNAEASAELRAAIASDRQFPGREDAQHLLALNSK